MTSAAEPTSAPAAEPQPIDLPSPAERPDAEVVIYDGACGFCRGQVNRLHRWDSRRRLSFISLHDPWVAEQFPDLSHDALMREMFLIDRQGRRYAGVDAIRRISRLLPRMWPLVPFLHFPGTRHLWRWGYQQVAKRRYRLAGKCENGTCSVHHK